MRPTKWKKLLGHFDAGRCKTCHGEVGHDSFRSVNFSQTPNPNPLSSFIMSSRRVLKAAESIRQVVSMAILVELKDPRIENVTVTFVEVSGDMRNAKVHVSVMGDETKQRLCINGLQNSAGYLQQKINERIDTRYVPKIKFVLDQGVKNSIEVTRILDEVLPKETVIGESVDNDLDSAESSDIDPDGQVEIADAKLDEASNEVPEEPNPSDKT